MRSLVLVSVVLGVALGSPQGFPVDTPEVMAARRAFIAEYNRLAELAALAPDIHIYHDDPRQRLQQLDALANHIPQATPVTTVQRPANPAFNSFSFSANLGNNQQFVPGPNTFPGAGHLAGHLAGHQAGVPAQPSVQTSHRFSPSAAAPVQRWPGPFAHTVPAGVGVPQAAMDTPEVAAAKRAHFDAHAAALGFRG
ncbi:hypothetical protein SK128_023427 [Halocaridina rubra]|uniref:Uncharacterized protein n=1 Tax=Halocaridina rubra TaxID=373956 RepID=A0AAN8ZVQ6_HALRR